MTIRQWCDENAILPQHFAAFQLALSRLSILELCSQFNAITGNFDPSTVNGFDKIKDVYRRDQHGNLVLRSDERAIFGQIVALRVAEEGRGI